MDGRDIRYMNPTALAYIGDAVYELYVRRKLLQRESVHVDRLHREATMYVRAEAQARVARRLLSEEGFLSEEETAVLKRARNHKISSKPKNADPLDYKLATAFEALVGWLYLGEREDRLEEILDFATEGFSEAFGG